MSEPEGSPSLGPTGFRRISSALIVLCGTVAVLRYAALRGWIPSPSVPWHLGEITVWILGSFCILWGLERGAPAGSSPAPFLRIYRLGVLLSAAGMLAVWVYG